MQDAMVKSTIANIPWTKMEGPRICKLCLWFNKYVSNRYFYTRSNSLPQICTLFQIILTFAKPQTLIRTEKKTFILLNLQNYSEPDSIFLMSGVPCRIHQRWSQWLGAFLQGHVSLQWRAMARCRHPMIRKRVGNSFRTNPVKSTSNTQKRP
jgi:hypothetical protein